MYKTCHYPLFSADSLHRDFPEFCHCFYVPLKTILPYLINICLAKDQLFVSYGTESYTSPFNRLLLLLLIFVSGFRYKRMSIELAHVPRVSAVRQHNRFVSVRPFHRMRDRVHARRRIRFMHRSEYGRWRWNFYNYDSRRPSKKKKNK